MQTTLANSVSSMSFQTTTILYIIHIQIYDTLYIDIIFFICIKSGKSYKRAVELKQLDNFSEFKSSALGLIISNKGECTPNSKRYGKVKVAL